MWKLDAISTLARFAGDDRDVERYLHVLEDGRRTTLQVIAAGSRKRPRPSTDDGDPVPDDDDASRDRARSFSARGALSWIACADAAVLPALDGCSTTDARADDERTRTAEAWTACVRLQSDVARYAHALARRDPPSALFHAVGALCMAEFEPAALECDGHDAERSRALREYVTGAVREFDTPEGSMTLRNPRFFGHPASLLMAATLRHLKVTRAGSAHFEVRSARPRAEAFVLSVAELAASACGARRGNAGDFLTLALCASAVVSHVLGGRHHGPAAFVSGPRASVPLADLATRFRQTYALRWRSALCDGADLLRASVRARHPSPSALSPRGPSVLASAFDRKLTVAEVVERLASSTLPRTREGVACDDVRPLSPVDAAHHLVRALVFSEVWDDAAVTRDSSEECAHAAVRDGADGHAEPVLVTPSSRACRRWSDVLLDDLGDEDQRAPCDAGGETGGSDVGHRRLFVDGFMHLSHRFCIDPAVGDSGLACVAVVADGPRATKLHSSRRVAHDFDASPSSVATACEDLVTMLFSRAPGRIVRGGFAEIARENKEVLLERVARLKSKGNVQRLRAVADCLPWAMNVDFVLRKIDRLEEVLHKL